MSTQVPDRNEDPEAWEYALLDALVASDDMPSVCTAFGITVERAQEICGRSGHEWTHFEAGDGIWFQQGSDFCEVCRIAREWDWD